MASIEGLQTELFADLKTELKNDPSFDEDILVIKVKNAIREVKQRRNYGVTLYTENQIAADLEGFYSVIRNIALYDYNQIGAEFQGSHGENDISRTWIDRDKLFNGVVAFVNVF